MSQEIYKQYSNLSVYNIDAKGLLAMKLTSARVASKDLEDSLFLIKYLNLKKEEELFDIVQTYANPNQLTAKSNFFIQEVFIKYRESICENQIKSFLNDTREHLNKNLNFKQSKEKLQKEYIRSIKQYINEKIDNFSEDEKENLLNYFKEKNLEDTKKIIQNNNINIVLKSIMFNITKDNLKLNDLIKQNKKKINEEEM